MLYMRVRDQDYAVLPFDAETLPETVRSMFENKRFNLQQVERFLSQGYQMNFLVAGFVHETSRKIPTSLGIPIEIQGKMPTIASITGQVKLQLEPKDSLKRVKVHINVRPTYVSLFFS
jgi:hypothetical protein